MTQAGMVLVADDDASLLSAVRAAMEHHGMECDAVFDAYQAGQALRARKYDAIVADIHMAGNSRLELLSNEALPPVVLMTGDPSLETALQALRFGVTDYLVKPFSMRDLVQVVQRAVVKGQAISTVQLALDDAVKAVLRKTQGAQPSAPEPTQKTATRRERHPMLSALSEREQHIVGHLLEGARVVEIAKRLGISQHTVRNHLKSIFAKCKVHSQLELIAKLRSG